MYGNLCTAQICRTNPASFVRQKAASFVRHDFAVMERLGINQIVTADAGFDGLPEIERLDPAKVATWSERVVGQE